jgi:hypothetical protein
VLNPNVGIPNVAGVAVRGSGEIFVSTATGTGEVLQVDRADGDVTTSVLGNLGYGAGLAFDLGGNLVVQDANTSTFQGRLQRLPITASGSGLTYGTPVELLNGMQSSAGVMVDSEGDLFTTGSGGLFQVSGSPLAETAFDSNDNPFQFATAITFDPGSRPFERFSGPDGGRLAYMADFSGAPSDSFVTMLTPAKPGDYNADGHVDGNDYALWRNAFGSISALDADGNNNNVVDAPDYVLWRKNAAPVSAGAAHTIRVPEPASMAGASMAIFIATTLRRRLASNHLVKDPKPARWIGQLPG